MQNYTIFLNIDFCFYKDMIINDLHNKEQDDELYQRHVIHTDKGQEPLRIDKFLMHRIERATRNKIQQAIENGLVTVNGQTIKNNYKVKGNDEIVIFSDTSPEETQIKPEPIPLNIVYEDKAVIVVNKPAGLVVHPGVGNHSGTLLNGIVYHLIQQNAAISEQVLPRFGLVHRIDKNTSGLLLLAKTEQAVAYLAKQFFHHTIQRKYIALVWGDMEKDTGTIKAHIARHLKHRKMFDAYPEGEYGKEAVTHYKVLERFGYTTLVECVLETGRTHQIRVHMKYIGHPIFNDDTYGGDTIVKGTVYTKYKQFVDNCFNLCTRQTLHAKTLGFVHPETQQFMLFESHIPTDMELVIDKWRKYTHQNK